jgi:hypothetical protein
MWVYSKHGKGKVGSDYVSHTEDITYSSSLARAWIGPACPSFSRSSCCSVAHKATRQLYRVGPSQVVRSITSRRRCSVLLTARGRPPAAREHLHLPLHCFCSEWLYRGEESRIEILELNPDRAMAIMSMVRCTKAAEPGPAR